MHSYRENAERGCDLSSMSLISFFLQISGVQRRWRALWSSAGNMWWQWILLWWAAAKYSLHYGWLPLFHKQNSPTCRCSTICPQRRHPLWEERYMWRQYWTVWVWGLLVLQLRNPNTRKFNHIHDWIVQSSYQTFNNDCLLYDNNDTDLLTYWTMVSSLKQS